MIGDFCRETSVLVFVFGNLDIWLRSLTGELDKINFGWQAAVRNVGAIMALTLIFGVSGILFELWSE